MCLEKIDQELTKRYKARKKPIVAWKVIENTNHSIYNNYIWKLGLNLSSRKDENFTATEMLVREIDEGFHCFLEKPEDGLRPCGVSCLFSYHQCNNSSCSRIKIIEVLIDPKDVVAVGNGTGGTLDIVCAKAVWEKTDIESCA